VLPIGVLQQDALNAPYAVQDNDRRRAGQEQAVIVWWNAPPAQGQIGNALHRRNRVNKSVPGWRHGRTQGATNAQQLLWTRFDG
jgi:hypothetical protein